MDMRLGLVLHALRHLFITLILAYATSLLRIVHQRLVSLSSVVALTALLSKLVSVDMSIPLRLLQLALIVAVMFPSLLVPLVAILFPALLTLVFAIIFLRVMVNPVLAGIGMLPKLVIL